MSQTVRGDSFEPGSLCGGVEHIAAEVAVSEDAALRRRKDELSRGTPSHQLGQVVDEECGNRYVAALVIFRGTDDGLAADLGHGARDSDPSAEEVQVLDLECDRLAPAQACVAERIDQGL